MPFFFFENLAFFPRVIPFLCSIYDHRVWRNFSPVDVVDVLKSDVPVLYSIKKGSAKRTWAQSTSI